MLTELLSVDNHLCEALPHPFLCSLTPPDPTPFPPSPAIACSLLKHWLFTFHSLPLHVYVLRIDTTSDSTGHILGLTPGTKQACE